MKRTIIFYFFLFFIITNNVYANAYNELKSRLDKINYFQATFSQRVINSNGNLIQKSFGNIWIRYPNQFNWHIIYPDDKLMISDGDTLWIYESLIKQVTAFCLRDIINDIPFMFLIANAQNDSWQLFNIKQNGDKFFLLPKRENSNIKKFIININRFGKIYQFCYVEQNGQIIDYQLNSQKNNIIDISKFTFNLPKGVTFDDQRNK